jgi:protein KRI1
MLSDSDSSGDENDTSLKLKINQKFAKRYEDQKRFQDLQRHQELLGDLGESGSESESSSEDEDAVGLSTALDVEIMNTISSIKKKDPKIYEKNTKFYTQNAEDSDSSDDESSDEEGGKKKKKSKKNKKKTYKDVVREQLLSGKGDSDEDNQADGTYYDKEKALAYDQEQEKIRQKFLSSAMDSDDSDGEGDDMLTVKPKSAKEQAEEEERLKSAIAEVVSLTKKDTNLDPTEEDFLATYMLQKKWMDDADLKVDKKTDNFMTKEDEDELLDLEEDEEELYEVDKFESKYNFRFEEEQGEGGGNVIGGNNMGEVVGHARNVEGSLRRVDDKRKKKREERKERKEKEKRVKEAELRRLKNLKREEVSTFIKGGDYKGICLNLIFGVFFCS